MEMTMEGAAGPTLPRYFTVAGALMERDQWFWNAEGKRQWKVLWEPPGDTPKERIDRGMAVADALNAGGPQAERLRREVGL